MMTVTTVWLFEASGTKRNAEPHEPEGAQLQSRQHDRHADRTFQQGIRQPGMKWEHRRLERESEKHQPENQDLLTERNRHGQQFQQVERYVGSM